jgi:hypothetical protein
VFAMEFVFKLAAFRFKVSIQNRLEAFWWWCINNFLTNILGIVHHPSSF